MSSFTLSPFRQRVLGAAGRLRSPPPHTSCAGSDCRALARLPRILLRDLPHQLRDVDDPLVRYGWIDGELAAVPRGVGRGVGADRLVLGGVVLARHGPVAHDVVLLDR